MSTHNEERLVPQRDQPPEVMKDIPNQLGVTDAISKYNNESRYVRKPSTIEKEIVLGEMPVTNHSSEEFSDPELRDMIQRVEDHSNSSESTASLSSSDSGDDASSDSSDFTTPLIPKSTEPNICGERFSANNELVVGSEHSLFALNLQDNNGGQSVPNICINVEEQRSLISPFESLLPTHDHEYEHVPKESEKSDSMDVDIHYMESLSIKQQTYNGEEMLNVVRTTAILQIGDDKQAIDEYEGYKYPLTETGEFRNRVSCMPPLPLTTSGEEMVTGSQDTSLTHWGLSSMIPAGIMVEPPHLLDKSLQCMGAALNPLVTEVHDDPSNSVKFCTRKKIRTIKNKHRRATLTEDVPVNFPSDSVQCPEAFEGHRILRHMCQGKNFYEYADTLNYRKPRELKSDIDQILGRIPGRRHPSLTWGSLFTTLNCMKSLLEKAYIGLQHANRFHLAFKINEGIDELGDIIKKASRVQQLSLRSTK